MTTLSDYTIPETDVPLANGQSITVRGLSADAISALIRAQGDVVRAAYRDAIEGKLTVDTTAELVQTLNDEAPVLIGLIIAFGADDLDNIEKASRMSFVDQVSLVDEIIRLTLVTEGGVDKIKEIVARAVKLVAPTATLKP